MGFGLFRQSGKREMIPKVFRIAFRVFLNPQKAENPDFQVKTQLSIIENPRFSAILASFEGF